MNSRAHFVPRLALCLCLLLAGIGASAQSSKVFFSAPSNLSHNPDDTALAYSTHTAIDSSGNINVVYVEYDCLPVSPFTCTWHLYFTRSADAGMTFTPPLDIANPAPNDSIYGPQIAIDRAGNIDIAFEEDTATTDVYFVRSTDHGATFSLPLNVSMGNGLSSEPQLGVDSHGYINLVWTTEDLSTNTFSVYFSHSKGGVNFSAPVALCDATQNCESPQIAIDPRNHVNLVWAAATCDSCAEDVYFSRSINGGSTFATPLNLSNSPDPLVTAPRITAGPAANLNVVWSKGTASTNQIFYARSADGAKFSNPIAISPGTGNSSYPQLALGPLRWQDALNHAAQLQPLLARMVRASRSTSSSASFAPLDAINAAWYNDASGDVYFSRSINHGISFSAPKPVSTPTGSFGTEPYMAVDCEGRINIVWQDAATSNILFTRSNDGGQTFSKPRSASGSPSYSFAPQITLDATGNINLTWFDSTTPIEDVFYARGTSLNLMRNDVRALPYFDFKPHKRDAVLQLLEKARRDLTPKDHSLAIADLNNLLQHVDGCGTSPGSNDWITNCSAQLKIRSSLNIVISGLSQ